MAETKLNSGYVRPGNSAEILVMDPHLCTPDLSTRHDWPVKNAIVDSPIRMKRKAKRSSGNSLRPLGAHNKDIGAASQTSLTEVKLRLRRRLGRREISYEITNLHS